jgi:hypothetical protein
MSFSRRRRNLWVAAAALAGGLIFFVAGALADAGNPILGTIKGTAINNGDGTVTIYVRGQWNWLTHNGDCNKDRNGTGVGIIWDDPTEPGYLVEKGAVKAKVGIASLRPGDAVNKVDQMVHPSDRGNVPQGYSVGGTDYPLGQQFVDPNPPGITGVQQSLWRSGCGRQPLTATAPKGNHPEKVNQPCADNTTADGDPIGSTACANEPWGSWGYEKKRTINGNDYVGYSHTYELIQSTGPNAGQSGLPNKVCVNFYDVHGNNAGFEAPNATKEIIVGPSVATHNGDNSIETSTFNVNDGANCISLVTPTLTTSATDAKIGDPISDTATLSGVPAGAGGTLTFELYGPRAAGSPTPNCGGAVVFTSSVNVNGPGNYKSGNFSPTAAGTYDWKVRYSGDPSNLVLPVESACGDTSGANKEISRIVDANIEITPASATNPTGTNHTLTAHVKVNAGTGYANAPNGTTINFAIVSGPGSFVGRTVAPLPAGRARARP